MGYKAIRDGLQDLIDGNLTAITGTSYKVHERVPENLVDAHGYSIIIMPNGGGFLNKDTSQYEERQTWNIDLYSPNVGTSYRANQEDRLLDYADAIITIFTNKRTLAVESVTGLEISQVRFADGDYPVNAQSTKYHFRLVVTITYSRARSC
jgi:hypothetical protein